MRHGKTGQGVAGETIENETIAGIKACSDQRPADYEVLVVALLGICYRAMQMQNGSL